MTKHYKTKGNIDIQCTIEAIDYLDATLPLLDKLNTQRGALFTSSFEFPGRYTCWDIGFVNPPLVIETKENHVHIKALNERGCVLLTPIATALSTLEFIEALTTKDDAIDLCIKLSTKRFPEELRSKQPSVFSALRAILALFFSNKDPYLGLYGAFGYDLAFQFEAVKKKINRDPEQRDLVLYLPDELILVDHRKEVAAIHRYDFTINKQSTLGLKRDGSESVYQTKEKPPQSRDHEPGEYANNVAKAVEYFKRGDLFEVVPGQSFFEACHEAPANIFKRLREANPSPYGFFINLGEAEYLVGASPEMFIRTEGRHIETCPISGTIKRGQSAIEDAKQIQTLLNSTKDESELTMCTDVDRNDKSRICEPGSVKIIGRRQIEMYSRLIHTVDHVEGTLREEFDALDAFLSHTWAVTVTGAPKHWAMQFIEDHERSARCWYGGAIGWLNFNGNMNTGLTIRTIQIKKGIAEVRAGATLLFDSDPKAEEDETELKASALLNAIRNKNNPQETSEHIDTPGKNKHVLLIDHEDSFVHTLANYVRQTGAHVTTLRYGFDKKELTRLKPDLILLSPGPGKPEDFDMKNTIALALKHKLPLFGVCLGLQALVEYFGGSLGVLDYPMHGKPTKIENLGGVLFESLPETFTAARYHSLYAIEKQLPAEFNVTAQSDDGIIMAIEHKTLPIAAVQFHPESLLTLDGNAGLGIIENVIRSMA